MAPVRSIARLALLPVLVSLGACTATSLVRLDNEWAQTYRAKMQSIKDQDDYLATTSNYEAQFAVLSQRAAEAGDQALPDDPAMAVGFYRIAVLAAWKSEELREDKVPDLSTKGSAACDRLPKKSASQPRDCTLFPLVENFARYDKKEREFGTLPTTSSEPPRRVLTPAELDTALALHTDIAGIFDTIGDRRREMANLALPPSFHDYVKRNWKRVYCSTRPLRYAIYNSVEDGSAKKKSVKEQAESMQNTLKAEKITVDCPE